MLQKLNPTKRISAAVEAISNICVFSKRSAVKKLKQPKEEMN